MRSSSSSFPTPLASPAATTAPIEVPTYHAGSNPASRSARQAPRWAAVFAPPPLNTRAAVRPVTWAYAFDGIRHVHSGPVPHLSPAEDGEPASACPRHRV